MVPCSDSPYYTIPKMERDPSRYYPDLDPCNKHAAKADAGLEYWAGVFGKSMPTVNFNGRGWGDEPEK